MALDVEALCNGLADAVQRGTGLSCAPSEPDQIDPPCAFVMLADPFIESPHEAMNNGLARVALTVRLVGGTAAGWSDAVRALWPYLSSGTGFPFSVLDAIYVDTTFGGVLGGGGVLVQSVGGPRAAEFVTGQIYVVVDVPLTVLVTRS